MVTVHTIRSIGDCNLGFLQSPFSRPVIGRYDNLVPALPTVLEE